MRVGPRLETGGGTFVEEPNREPCSAEQHDGPGPVEQEHAAGETFESEDGPLDSQEHNGTHCCCLDHLQQIRDRDVTPDAAEHAEPREHG